jgi:hypothetical protein
MKNCQNSFLKFLQAELPTIPLHVIRKDYNYPEEGLLKVNALNVDFQTQSFRTDISTQMVILDVINEVEDTALSWASTIFELLSKRFYISKYDYAYTPARLLPGSIYWDRDAIDFREINVDYFARYSCTFNLYHYILLS